MKVSESSCLENGSILAFEYKKMTPNKMINVCTQHTFTVHVCHAIAGIAAWHMEVATPYHFSSKLFPSCLAPHLTSCETADSGFPVLHTSSLAELWVYSWACRLLGFIGSVAMAGAGESELLDLSFLTDVEREKIELVLKEDEDLRTRDRIRLG